VLFVVVAPKGLLGLRDSLLRWRARGIA